MVEKFKINGIDATVDYNDFIFSHADVQEILDGVKTTGDLDEINDIDIINYDEVYQKLSSVVPANAITKVIDCTELIDFVVNFLGDDISEIPNRLAVQFDFKNIKELGNNKYEVTGSKKSFNAYQRYMRQPDED